MGSGWLVLGCAALLACSPNKPGAASPQLERSAPTSSASASSAARLVSTLPPGSTWATALDATSQVASRPAGACFSDAGCPAVAAALPSCSADLKAPDLAEVADELSRHVGQTVLVSGRLFAQNDTGSELGQCLGCCGPSRRPLRLAPRLGLSLVLGLSDARNAQAFWCQADASQICCGFELVSQGGGAEQRVAVFGKLVDTEESLTLEAPQLCSLVPNGAAPAGATASARCQTGDLGEAEAFDDGALRCGCRAGVARCRSIDPNTCFLHGSWFDDGTQVRSRCMQRLCQQGTWASRGQPCPAAQ